MWREAVLEVFPGAESRSPVRVEALVDAEQRLGRGLPAAAQLYMPFDALLFFGDNGGGDQFAFVQTPGLPP